MKRTFMTLIIVAFLSILVNSATAEQDLLQSVADGCKAEIDNYCSQVTPGQGRVLACLYAHGDKLSAKCEYALYDAANECDADLEKFCSSVEAGEGRLLQCLEKNDKQVSGRCKEALKEVGLK